MVLAVPRRDGQADAVRLIDLSVPLRTGMPVYPGDPEVTLNPALTVARDGVNVLHLDLGSQTGTHVDAPVHIDDRLPALDELPLDRFLGPAVVIDARGLAPRTPLGLEYFEGRVASGQIVLIATGWARHWGTPDYLAHPYPTPEVAAYLVESGVRTIGVDALSVDPTPAEDIPVHRILCGAHAVIAENLTDLSEVLAAQDSGHRIEVSLLPLSIPRADGSPVRAIARIWQDEPPL
ncbi:cyclase family protein [Nocardia huaxiensis]|uniref:Cyclase family protein n=1 Tax=Nocardia huaxiensis TaxID=2755382 RepID=A0A7D6ZLR5_9NOCA|nr:cyclase family protein [Nocardia huaxiensis]QLY30383.1 cyclase family protein [Nocardia huaxiensis]UFS95978.1 cyclase family protein [Nocardia huaxiensis]